jgi:hypothetical protein
MRVAIIGVEKVNEHLDKFFVSMGDQTYDCPVSDGDAGPLNEFRFESPFIEAVFHFNGIGAMFARDYWRFRDGDGRPFPWDYGQHDEEIVCKAGKFLEKTMKSG